MSEEFSYDRVPYPSLIFPQTNIDRLAMLARYFGMETADPTECRVLELGCGDGTNLLAQAYSYPKTTFMGIDLSKAHIDQAQKCASMLGLNNVEFIQGDILHLSRESLGQFDYIVAHGLYSWVPPVVREHTMKIYQDCLAENAVGYISFNINPGSYFRKSYWEAIKFRTRDIHGLQEKMAAAQQFASFLRQAVPQDSTFKRIVENETEILMNEAAEYLFHDDLGDLNDAFFFYEFMETAERYGLQFVSDANPPAMFGHDFAPEALKFIDEMSGGDFIKRQQYFDLIKARRFRSTLLCRDSIKLNRFPDDEIIDRFFIVSPLNPSTEGGCVWDKTEIEFATQDRATIKTDEPLTKMALLYLNAIWSSGAPLNEVVERAIDALSGHSVTVNEKDVQSLRSTLRYLFEGGVVTLQTCRREFSTEPGERPMASLFAQLQLARGEKSILSLSGMNYSFENDFLKRLIKMLNGKRDRTNLAAEMQRSINVSPEQRDAVFEKLPAMIESGLKQLGRLGFLLP